MRPFLAVIIYLTAMCGAGVSAGYVSLVLVERGLAGEAPSEDLERGTKVYFARQASVFTWGMGSGTLLFIVTHIVGLCWLKGGLAQIRAEADPDDLLLGLWVYLGAAVLAALLGGLAGAMVG